MLILVCIGVHKKWEMVDVCSQGKKKRGGNDNANPVSSPPLVYSIIHWQSCMVVGGVTLGIPSATSVMTG